MDQSGQRDRDFQALQERLSRLGQAGLRINESLDFDRVLREVLDSARSLTGARYGVMTLLDRGGEVQDFLSSGTTEEEAEQLWLTPQGLGIFQALTNVSGPVRIPDLAAHVRGLGFTDFAIPVPVDVFRFMAAPMFHQGDRAGLVFVGCKDDGEEFSQADEETLAMFAAWAALVIANAGVHREERRARTDLETLVDTWPAGVAVFDAGTGEPRSFNREALRILGRLREEGQTPEDLLEAATCVRQDGREISLAELSRSGETVRAGEIELRVPGGRSVSVLLNATPIHSGDGEPASFAVTLQDLVPPEEQERLRAEFLAMVSHELRTPLAAVKGSVDTLLEAAGELHPRETAQFDRIIRDQSERMRRLIGDPPALVEETAGRIRAEIDGPGPGARSTLKLPAADGRASGGSRRQARPRGRVPVLAVDGDPQALRHTRDMLARAGYAPIATGDPAEVPRLMAEHKPRLALLDLAPPGTGGIELMQQIHRTAQVPVVFLSEYSQDDTVARAFDMGAADHVLKPFSHTELAARIRAALRRGLEPVQGEPPGRSFALGQLSIDYAQRRVALDGEPVDLTGTEYAVLYQLAAQAPKVLTHGLLLRRVWGPERAGEGWLLRNVVKKLRRKLGDDAASPRYIVTEPRVGYRMAAGDAEEPLPRRPGTRRTRGDGDGPKRGMPRTSGDSRPRANGDGPVLC